MNVTTNPLFPVVPECVVHDLCKLNVPIYLTGYRQLCVAIPIFAKDITQTMCNELYPAVAKAIGYYDWRSIEFSIRRAIVAAWERRDPDVWEEYFPGFTKVPTNKQFIATLAMRIK